MSKKSKPVVVISDSDLIDNGGQYQLIGKTALKVSGDDTSQVIGGKPAVVYSVSSDQIASGEFKLAGGNPVHVAQVSDRGRESSSYAVPVFDPSGAWPSTSFVGPYDDIPNLVHLYEIARRGLTSYTGNLVRIRRSSDNSEQDFGYSASTGELDTAAIATFVGAGSGFVVTVYDQIGSNNPTQATAGSQPAYVASGQNSKPVTTFDGSDDYLTVVLSTVLQPLTTFAAAALVAAVDSNNRVLYSTIQSGVEAFYQRTTNKWAMNAGTVVEGGTTDTAWHVWSLNFNGASSQGWKDGITEVSGDPGTKGIASFFLGAWPTPQWFWSGGVSMFAIVNASLSTADRQAMETAINDYYAIY